MPETRRCGHPGCKKVWVPGLLHPQGWEPPDFCEDHEPEFIDPADPDNWAYTDEPSPSATL